MGFIGHDGSISTNLTLTVSDTCVREDSYLEEVRFNLLANVTASGAGLAYIVDSPPDSNATALVIVDLGKGDCWRRLESHRTTLPVEDVVPSYNGVPFYPTPNSNHRNNGLYGIELSHYGEHALLPRPVVRLPVQHPDDVPQLAQRLDRCPSVGGSAKPGPIG